MRKTHMAILAALAAGALACGGGGDDDDNGDDVAPGDAAPAATIEKVATIGQPARDGDFEFIVTKMDCSKTKIGSAPLTTEAQGKFCLVSVTVKNIGGEAGLFDASSQKALDAKGTTYDADGGAAIYVNKQAETFLNSINPGNQVKGVLPFDVPKAVKITHLELHDSTFSGGVKVKVG